MNPDEDARLAWLADVRATLAEAVERDTAVLGICLGAQLLGQALGVGAPRLAQPELGWFQVELTAEGADDALLGPLAPACEVFQWHDYGCELPEGAVPLARSRARAAAGVPHRRRRLGDPVPHRGRRRLGRALDGRGARAGARARRRARRARRPRPRLRARVPGDGARADGPLPHRSRAAARAARLASAQLAAGFRPLRVEASGSTVTGAEAGSGPPLVLLHGLGGTWEYWGRTMTLLRGPRALRRARPPRLRALGRAARRVRARLGRRRARGRAAGARHRAGRRLRPLPRRPRGRAAGAPPPRRRRARDPGRPERAEARAGLAGSRAEARAGLPRAAARAVPLGALAAARGPAAARRPAHARRRPRDRRRRDRAQPRRRRPRGARAARRHRGVLRDGPRRGGGAPGGAGRRDLGRPRPHGAARRRRRSCWTRVPSAVDPLPAGLRPPADGRAPRGVRGAARRARRRFDYDPRRCASRRRRTSTRCSARRRRTSPTRSASASSASSRRSPDDHPVRAYAAQRLAVLDALGHATSRAEGGDPSAPQPA